MLKKFLMIIISIMLVFTLTVTKPQQQVKAFALTTATLYTTYLLGGLAIGALADLGLNDGQATKAVWDGTKEFVEKSGSAIVNDVSNVITQTEMLGKGYIALGSSFWDAVQSDAVAWSQEIAGALTIDFDSTFITNHEHVNYIEHNQTIEILYTNLPKIQNTLESGYIETIYTLPFSVHSISSGITYTHIRNNSINYAYSLYNPDLKEYTRKGIYNLSQKYFYIQPGYYTYSNVIVEVLHQLDVWANQVGDQVDKVLNHAKQQGKLNIPLDGMSALGAGGIGLAYDAANDQWKNRTTGEVYLGDITLDDTFIRPMVDDAGALVLNPDIGIPRVGVNVKDVPWAPSIESGITDIYTGENVNTDTDVGTGETTLPGESTANPSSINWQKLKLAGHLFTTAFPFSLPFDIAKALDAVFGGLTSTDIPDLNFVMFDTNFVIRFPQVLKGYLVFIRSMMLIIFDVSLVYSVRKWFGGAS